MISKGYRSIREVMALEIQEIGSEEELDKVTMHGITLVDFDAPWCAPCLLQEPIIHQLAAQFQGKARMVVVNIDQAPDMASTLGIRSIPTLVIFKNSKEIQRFVGLQSEGTLSEALNKLCK